MSRAEGGNVTRLVRPDGYDRKGAFYRRSSVNEAAVKLILYDGSNIERRAKNVTSDLDRASEVLEEANKRFSTNLDELVEREKAFSVEAKRVSGSIRDSSTKLAEGLARLEKTANFDRLERMTILLERAQVALASLAEMRRDGKLERIAELLNHRPESVD